MAGAAWQRPLRADSASVVSMVPLVVAPRGACGGVVGRRGASVGRRWRVCRASVPRPRRLWHVQGVRGARGVHGGLCVCGVHGDPLRVNGAPMAVHGASAAPMRRTHRTPETPTPPHLGTPRTPPQAPHGCNHQQDQTQSMVLLVTVSVGACGALLSMALRPWGAGGHVRGVSMGGWAWGVFGVRLVGDAGAPWTAVEAPRTRR